MLDLEAYRTKLMKNPEHYIELLRRQNQLHCVWHVELQERIAELEAENAQLREDKHARD